MAMTQSHYQEFCNAEGKLRASISRFSGYERIPGTMRTRKIAHWSVLDWRTGNSTDYPHRVAALAAAQVLQTA